MLDRIVIQTDPATGGAGAATATAYSPDVSGEVLAVDVAYGDSPPATTDVTLQDENDPRAENIVDLANANTDVKIYPRRVTELNDGTDITYDGTNEVYTPYIVHGRLKLTIAQANNDDYVTATIWVRR
jgi:hypothetical protein